MTTMTIRRLFSRLFAKFARRKTEVVSAGLQVSPEAIAILNKLYQLNPEALSA